MEPILSVRGLTVDFDVGDSVMSAVDQVSFDVHKGERLGLVGESGSGKSVIARAIMGLIRHPGYIAGGSVLFDGIDLIRAKESTLNRIRGRRIALIPQDASLALNPVLRVGDQMREMLARHPQRVPGGQASGPRKRLPRAEVRRKSWDTLLRVGLADPERVFRSYSSELSGGMKQRVGIAMALLCDPELLIADDPTSAVDVTIQAQILKEFSELTKRLGVSVLFISHDLRVVSTLCSRIVVLYAGQVDEIGVADELLHHPRHPYTAALVRCSPTVDSRVNPLPVVPGATPDVPSRIPGCRFNPRCPQMIERCQIEAPPLEGEPTGAVAEGLGAVGTGVACWNPNP